MSSVPKDHDTHNCGRTREIIYLHYSWVLDDGNDGYIKIDYCPYCGVKL